MPVMAFDKIDGTNIRIEFSHKRGFYKFGTRKTMFDVRGEEFGFVVPLFMEKFEKDLTSVFKTEKYKKVERFLCYFELFGEDSEFGQHDVEQPFDLVLLDVDVYKKGYVKPYDFIKDFGHLKIPRVIHDGILDAEFVQRIKNDETLDEGVICKTVLKKKKGGEEMYHCKIKTKNWMKRLKEKDLDLYYKELDETEKFEYEPG